MIDPDAIPPSPPPARDLTRKLATAGLLLAMAPFFFVGGTGTADPPALKALQNLGHEAFFAVATFLAWIGLPSLRRRAGWPVLTLFSLIALLLGLVIEGAQSGLARAPDWRDIGRDLLGVWLTWFLIVRPPLRLRLIGQAVTTALLACELLLVIHAFVVDWRIQHRLPLLADFESAREAADWSGHAERSRDVASHGRFSLKVRLDTGRYPGTTPGRLPRDWRAWEYLAFDIFNPDPDTLRMTIIVGDRRHYRDGFVYTDRFNRDIRVVPGWNSCRFALAEIADAPARRPMDLAEIVTLGIFAMDLPEPRAIYLDHFRLE